jgi:acyl dehydratase
VSAHFEDLRGGEDVPALARVVTREDVRAYAEASGDPNPLHQDDEVARSVGFPGIIAHGMFTMGHLAACVASWAGDPVNVIRLTAQFRSPVFMNEVMVAGGRVRALDPDTRTATLELWVTLERDGVTEFPVRKGEAEVRFPSS